MSNALSQNNLGVAYHAERRFLDSDTAHKQCLALLEAGDPPQPCLVAQSLANRAALYRSFHEFHEAERLFQLAMRIWDRHGWPSASEMHEKNEILWADVFEEDGLLRSFGREVRQLREADEETLQNVLLKLGPWYHDIQLRPHISTNPINKQYMESRWRFLEPFVPKDLTGKTVLDIGCNAGYFSLEMKKRNAAKVIGIDIMAHCLAQARFLSHWFERPLELRQLDVYDADRLGRFDYIVFIGVLYHLRHPLLALEKLASICNDTMYLQSMLRGIENDFEPADDYPAGEWKVFEKPEFPRLHFIEKSFNSDESNWWVPNRSCLKAMARTAGFRKLEESGHPEVIVCRK